MADTNDLIRAVVHVLEGMSIPYIIGGSVALAVWATPRTTHDLDLVVDLPGPRIAEFCGHFSPARYVLDAQALRAAFRDREQPSQGMYSFTDSETGFKADLFPLRTSDPAQVTALGRHRRMEVLEGLEAAVYAPDDLLVQKLRWYVLGESERQFRDCLNLLVTDRQRPTPLIAPEYVAAWAARLGPALVQAWARVQAAASR